LACCRTAALGGHVERCLDYGPERIAYNSCRNRHCPKCQAQAASATLRELAADPHWLGAQLGSLLVLHTWGQNPHHHPHVHAVVSGGGLSCNAQGGF
jgi:hypothetical protein